VRDALIDSAKQARSPGSSGLFPFQHDGSTKPATSAAGFCVSDLFVGGSIPGVDDDRQAWNALADLAFGSV